MPKVMLVEDDNNLREIYEARLQAEGFTIVSAKDGEEALAVAKTEKPDLIISDVMMPKISGFEMLDILRNTDGLKDVKIMMLTALGQGDDQQRAVKLGADKYLVKSQVTLEDIVKVSHELLSDEEGSTPKEATPQASAPPPVPPPPAPSVPTSAPNQVNATSPPAPVMPQVTPVATAPTTTAPAAAETSTAALAPEVSPAISTAASETATTSAPTSTLSTTALGAQPTSNGEMPAKDASPILDTAQKADDNKPVGPFGVNAQTTSDEVADMEAEIESFVAGATTEATPPTPKAEETPEVKSASTNEVKDDKLLQDALTTLSTEEKPADSSGPKIKTTSSVESTEASKVKETEKNVATSDIEAIPEPEQNEGVAIAHKLVIAPPDKKEKPDIQTLFALEQAKEASGTPEAAPSVITSDTPKTEAEPPENGGDGPMSIAL